MSRTSHHQQAAELTLKHWALFFDSEWTALCLLQTESLPNSGRAHLQPLLVQWAVMPSLGSGL